MDFFPIAVFAFFFLWNSIITYLFVSQRNAIKKVSSDGKTTNIIDTIAKLLESNKQQSKTLNEVNKKVEDLIFDSQFYIQNIGLVRFNPFNDTGGDQSFILALVDDRESGVVISGLHTRNGTRWYSKKILNGKGVEHELSSDEIKAIKSAMKKAHK